jgi:2-polyprenyl-3-methyl-5-hydroxy-6-metoxy-1,4-benzoquinol methylase
MIAGARMTTKQNSWAQFWDLYPRRAEPDNLLAQVGKTVGGVPITEKQVSAICDDVIRNLQLGPRDRLFDLCCGNGLLTRRLAAECASVVGVDFSAPLIEQAKEASKRSNVEYFLGDVRRIDKVADWKPGQFNKVLIYEALAFLDRPELRQLLKSLRSICSPDCIFLFGSTLDAGRRRRFFNTLRRKLVYFFKIRLLGRDPGLGRWWRRKEITRICQSLGLRCEFRDQNKVLHTAHYRIDVVVKPAEVAEGDAQ